MRAPAARLLDTGGFSSDPDPYIHDWDEPLSADTHYTIDAIQQMLQEPSESTQAG